jgi:hypothetical protein
MMAAAGLARAGVTVALALGLSLTAAQAQLARTFVSAAGGNDGNDCNRSTPCRTFQAAHDNTLPAGEITVLDPGGYGAVTITKAISIINDGVGEAGALVSSGVNGVTVAAAAGDAVSLRGLTVKGIGFGGGNGIVFNSGKSLTVENCVIRNLDGVPALGNGILFQPDGTSSLAVSNTLVADNTNSGIAVRPAGSGSVTASLSRVEAYNNFSIGVVFDAGSFSGTVKGNSTATIKAVIADSIAAQNQTGFAVGTSGPDASLMLTRSVAANNAFGIAADNNQPRTLIPGAGATLRVGQSVVTGNSQKSWLVQNNAVLVSYGTNAIDDNADGDPAPPRTPTK